MTASSPRDPGGSEPSAGASKSAPPRPDAQRRDIIQRLSQQLRRLEASGGVARSQAEPAPPAAQKEDAIDLSGAAAGVLRDVLPSDIAPLNEILPQGGFPAGSVIEWLGDETGGGVETLAILSVRQLFQSGRGCVLIDAAETFYPPALARLLGEPPAAAESEECAAWKNFVLVRPPSREETWWALEQSLRCRGVGLTLCRLEQMGDRVARRLQLAAEAGGGLGFLIRPAGMRKTPSWSAVRLLVEARSSPAISPATPTSATAAPGDRRRSAEPGRRLRVEVLHVRGGMAGKSLELEWDDETGDVHLAASLAAAIQPAGDSAASGTAASRAARFRRA